MIFPDDAETRISRYMCDEIIRGRIEPTPDPERTFRHKQRSLRFIQGRNEIRSDQPWSDSEDNVTFARQIFFSNSDGA